MGENELLDELMHYIETFRLRHVLTKLAQRCESDRLLLISHGQKDYESITYLSNEQTCLEATSIFLAEVERDGLEKLESRSKHV
jgi:hypothetical protein